MENKRNPLYRTPKPLYQAKQDENVPEEFMKMYEEALGKMFEQEKNIPFTHAQIRMFPIGFVRTSVYPTRSYGRNGSKFISERMGYNSFIYE